MVSAKKVVGSLRRQTNPLFRRAGVDLDQWAAQVQGTRLVVAVGVASHVFHQPLIPISNPKHRALSVGRHAARSGLFAPG